MAAFQQAVEHIQHTVKSALQPSYTSYGRHETCVHDEIVRSKLAKPRTCRGEGTQSTQEGEKSQRRPRAMHHDPWLPASYLRMLTYSSYMLRFQQPADLKAAIEDGPMW
jgi:hypothetical protein